MRWDSSIAGAGDSRPACTTSSASSPGQLRVVLRQMRARIGEMLAQVPGRAAQEHRS